LARAHRHVQSKSSDPSLSSHSHTLIANEHEASLRLSRRCLGAYSKLACIDLDYPCLCAIVCSTIVLRGLSFVLRWGTQKGSQGILQFLLLQSFCLLVYHISFAPTPAHYLIRRPVIKKDLLISASSSKGCLHRTAQLPGRSVQLP
jgi:hypothetical protein